MIARRRIARAPSTTRRALCAASGVPPPPRAGEDARRDLTTCTVTAENGAMRLDRDHS
jgi:hypothetical protein